MNERIKQLALQSQLVYETTDGKVYNSWEDYVDLTEYVEKFAELIVRECINQVLEEKVSEDWIDKEDDIEDRCYLRGNNDGIVDAVIRIKQHFGVEE